MKYFLIILIIILSSKVIAEETTEIIFMDGANKYESEAIASTLYNEISETLREYVKESHFVYGPVCNSNEECRQNLQFNMDFETASYDLNLDGKNEVIVTVIHTLLCGSGGCTSYILEKKSKVWKVIGRFFPSHKVEISLNKNNDYFNIYYFGKSGKDSCIYKKNNRSYDYDCGY